MFFVIPVNNLVIDSMFKKSENIAIAHFLVMNSSSCCWPAVQGVAYTIVGSKLVLLHLRMCTVLTGNLDMLLGR